MSNMGNTWLTSRGFSRVTVAGSGSSSTSLALVAFPAAGASLPGREAGAVWSTFAFLAAGGGGSGASGSELQLKRNLEGAVSLFVLAHIIWKDSQQALSHRDLMRPAAARHHLCLGKLART